MDSYQYLLFNISKTIAHVQFKENITINIQIIKWKLKGKNSLLKLYTELKF